MEALTARKRDLLKKIESLRNRLSNDNVQKLLDALEHGMQWCQATFV